MTQHLHPPATQSKLSLKDLIIHILEENNSVLTLDEILTALKRHRSSFDTNKTKIRALVNKLAKKSIIEYVYIDLSYGIRLKHHQKNSKGNLEVVS